MQTLYIDVYFLINFTVDFIALYFAVTFSKVPTTTAKLFVGAIIGALTAIVIVFMPEVPLLNFTISIIGLLLTVFFSVNKISAPRMFKVLLSFWIFGALLGGFIYYLYGIFDKYLYEFLKETEGGAQNRKILMFSVIVLLSIGVFKMLVSFFKNIESEGSGEIEITIFGKSLKTEAFFDSGNLAVDPMDMRPILFIKEELAQKILPKAVIELKDPDELDRDTRKRIRLIPISRGGSTHVLTGLRFDSVYLIRDEKKEELSVTVAIDKEGGSYGGFYALLPSSAIQNAKK